MNPKKFVRSFEYSVQLPYIAYIAFNLKGNFLLFYLYLINIHWLFKVNFKKKLNSKTVI